jgi:hypothetical protein
VVSGAALLTIVDGCCRRCVSGLIDRGGLACLAGAGSSWRRGKARPVRRAPQLGHGFVFGSSWARALSLASSAETRVLVDTKRLPLSSPDFVEFWCLRFRIRCRRCCYAMSRPVHPGRCRFIRRRGRRAARSCRLALTCGVPGVRGRAVDQVRARAEAVRRPRGRLRRYCAANRLNRLGTLTYRGEGCFDQRLVREHVGEFMLDLRTQLGGDPFPYAWVPEWHPKGHGLHLHFTVGQFIAVNRIKAAWPHGFVHIKLLGDLPIGSGSLAEARRAAGYLSPYIGKSFEDPRRIEGTHRYDVAQGFTARVQRITGDSAREVIASASARFGAAPTARWSSEEVADWQGGSAI